MAVELVEGMVEEAKAAAMMPVLMEAKVEAMVVVVSAAAMNVVARVRRGWGRR